ncbi:FMN-binding negative transcriptional regulator [Rhizobium rhizogenes]|uniref:FMN-binding negative transcriptional regulator n=1 Tax=Rhizobium rhizogenes TaxID=359 RepID=UPI003867ED83
MSIKKLTLNQLEYLRQNLLQCLIETFPFAVIVINGNGRPLVARAPLTFRDKPGSAGAIEFHLAQQNSIVDTIADGMPATIIIDGPSAHISPSWYTARCVGSQPHRANLQLCECDVGGAPLSS